MGGADIGMGIGGANSSWAGDVLGVVGGVLPKESCQGPLYVVLADGRASGVTSRGLLPKLTL